MDNNYPSWICSPCGRKYGKRLPWLATYHTGDTCGWCNATDVPVTEPRDFGYPEPPKDKTRKGRGAGRKPARVHVTLRIPPHVLDYYGGDTLKMREAWVAHVEELILQKTQTSTLDKV